MPMAPIVRPMTVSETPSAQPSLPSTCQRWGGGVRGVGSLRSAERRETEEEEEEEEAGEEEAAGEEEGAGEEAVGARAPGS